MDSASMLKIKIEFLKVEGVVIKGLEVETTASEGYFDKIVPFLSELMDKAIEFKKLDNETEL